MRQTHVIGSEAANLPVTAVNMASLITGIAFTLGLFFDLLFYGKMVGLSFPVYVCLMETGLLIIRRRLGIEWPASVLWLFLPLTFFSAMIAFRSSLLLTFLNIVASLLLLLLIAELSCGKVLKQFSTDDYVGVPFLPFKFVRPMGTTISELMQFPTVGAEQRSRLSQITRGTIIAAPAVFIFTLLLSSADLVFKSYVVELLDIRITPEAVFRSFLVLATTLVFMGAYSYLRPAGECITRQRNKKVHSVGYIEIAVVLGSVSALFLAFLTVQFAYLFGGERNIGIAGVTYSEYARHGFFELLAVAVLSLLMLWTIDKYAAFSAKRGILIFKILGIALIAEVLVIMVSAFVRLLLYERVYGFTTLRLYSHVFTLFLATIFVLLLLKLLRGEREEVFAFRAFASVILFLGGMNLLNPDAFIARENMLRFTATGKLDDSYVLRLSDDAMPEMLSLMSSATDDRQRGLFARALYDRLQSRKSAPFSSWQSFNLARRNATMLLDARAAELEPFKDFEFQRR